MALHSKPGFSQASYAAGYEGAAPDHMGSMQATVDLPHGVEIVPEYRAMSRLPAEGVRAYQTADAHVQWRFRRHWQVAVNGRNLLQPYHAEFGGDNAGPAGIRRSLYAELQWSWSK